MARTSQSTRSASRRRRFGKIERKISANGQISYDASYIPPVEARAQYPHLPARIHKRFDEGYETQAEAWLNEAKRLIDLNAWAPPEVMDNADAGSKVLFRDYAADYVEKRRKANNEPIQQTTKEKYQQYLRDYLNPVLGNRPMAAIRPADIRQWYDSMHVTKDGCGESIRRHVFELLDGIMSHAANAPLDDAGTTLIKRSPVQFKVPRPATKHVYKIATYAQVQAIADQMPPSPALAVTLSGFLGLRQGEALGLQRHDFELNEQPPIVHIRRAATEILRNGHKEQILGSTKTPSSVRDIEIPAPLVPIIKRHLEIYMDDKPTALVFTGTRTHGIVRGQSLRSAFIRAVKAVGDPDLQGMDFHDLRHSGLTLMAEAGATVGQLMQRGGHTNIKTVAVYQQSSAEAEAKLRAKIESNINASTGLPSETADAEVDTPNMSDASLAANTATAPTTAESASAKHTTTALTKNDATPNTMAIEESASSPANTPNTQQPASPDAVPANAENSVLQVLADTIAAMPSDARLSVLRALDDDKRAKILKLLPLDVQVDTVQRLIQALA